MLHSAFKAQSAYQRKQAKWLFIGLSVGLAPLTVFVTLPAIFVGAGLKEIPAAATKRFGSSLPGYWTSISLAGRNRHACPTKRGRPMSRLVSKEGDALPTRVSNL
ncbi:MAG: hypothetical protein ACE5PV_16110 [Candidatus Poribacteria bacterium]